MERVIEGLWTTPKFSPPPLSPQSRSGFSFVLAVIERASEVTICAAMRLSHAAPYFGVSHPKPYCGAVAKSAIAHSLRPRMILKNPLSPQLVPNEFLTSQ